MAKLTLFDLCGVQNANEMANLWPRFHVQFAPGLVVTGSDVSDFEHLMTYLNRALTFQGVRPGASFDRMDLTGLGEAFEPVHRVGLTAELVVSHFGIPPSEISPLVLTGMFDIPFYLLETPVDKPARLFVTHSERGIEVVIEGLPVEIQLPSDMLGPLPDEAEEQAHPGGGPDVKLTDGDFDASLYDGLEIILREPQPSIIRVHVKVRMTEEHDFIVEPAVPISFGPCRFLGLPCKAVHDFALLPSPTLRGDHHPTEQALEWTRHTINPIELLGEYVEHVGMVTARTLDFDYSREPMKTIMDSMNADIPEADNQLELVLEDIAVPLAIVPPLPVHARFGLRRKVITGNEVAEAFDLSLAPAEIKIPRLSDNYRLLIFRLLLETVEPPTLRGAFVEGEQTSESSAATISTSEDGLLQVGWMWGEPYGFTVASARVELKGLKVGLDLPEFFKSLSDWDSHFQLLADLQIRFVKSESTEGGPFKVTSKSGKDVDLYWYDVGWDRGQPSFKNFMAPKEFEVSVADVFKARIDEMGIVTENNGGQYFLISGGFPFLEAGDNNNGIFFHRLRFRIAGNESAPGWLLDGLTLGAKIGVVQFSGTGMISEFNREGHDYREFGFGVEAGFSALDKDFLLAMQIFKGRISGPTNNFSYWLFAFKLSAGLPIASGFEIYNLSLLAARNMTPVLDAPDPDGQQMRLFKWYKANPNGLMMPLNRILGAWKPVDESFAWGVGARTSTAGAHTVALELFAFAEQSPEGSAFLAGLEVYILKSDKPVGFAIFEWDVDSGKWGFMLGINMKLDMIVSSLPSFLSHLAALSGTLYIGNKPSTVALGQLNDTASWLSFHFDTSGFFDSSLLVGVCYQRVSVPQGPNAFAAIASIKGGKDFGFGRVQAYVEFGLLVGRWRNESDCAGFLVTLKAGLRIKVFWAFSFGVTINIDFTYVASTPRYRRLDALLKIDTPWYLPDVSFHFENVWNSVQVESVPVFSTPIISAGALSPHARSEVAAGVTPIFGNTIAERDVYTIAQMQGVGNPSLSDGDIRQLTPVGLDSVIGLDFKPSVRDMLTIGENTPSGAGVEAATAPAVSDLEAAYELVEVGIRRRPRFNGTAEWTTVLDPEETRIGGLPNYSPDPDEDQFRSFIRFQWDKDFIRDGQWDARRLLINSSTPYTFFAGNAETDELLAHDEEGWPCCTGGGKEVWHELAFDATPFGVRTPTSQTFTESSSTLHWIGPRPPVVMSGIAAPLGSHAARARFEGRPSGIFAVISFDEPVHAFQMFLYWLPAHSHGAIAIEGYIGLEQKFSKTFALATAQPPLPLRFDSLEGFTSVELHFVADISEGPTPAPPVGNLTDNIEIVRMQYRTVREKLRDIVHGARCGTQDEHAHDGGGTLAWLPNHEYEISAVTRMTLEHSESGSQEVEVRQKAYFRTKGLIGLNASEAIGEEVEPYVESRYPENTILYRAEAVALAFNEKFNILLPVDFTPSPGDPDELTQVLEWVLAVEKVTAAIDAERISQTSPDWVVEHRGIPLPPWPGRPVVLDSTIAKALVRQAVTTDPLRKRFENMVFGPFGCQPGGKHLHHSQVLTHEPVNPRGVGDEQGRWESGAVYRVNLRQKGSPDGPFVERKGFDVNDYTAFSAAAESGTGVLAWRSENGAMHLQNPPGDGLRRYAVFGEPGWNHIQIRSDVDPQGASAGIAVGVEKLFAVTQAAIVLIDEPGRRLKILERSDGTVTERGSTPLHSEAFAPYSLEVMAFDDKLRARINDAVVEVDRNEIREGKLALVADGGGKFHNLVVEPLDAYRFQFQASRFVDFPTHIASFRGKMDELPADTSGLATATAATLLADTGAEIADLMRPGADSEARQRLFDRWTTGLALPLRKRTTALEVTRVVSVGQTELLLLESPEPLPFSVDVRVELNKRTFVLPLPAGAGGLPLFLRRIGVSIDFDGDRITLGPIPPSPATRPLMDLRWLVQAVEVDRVLEYRVYAMRVRLVAGKIIAVGRLSETIRPGAEPGSSPLLAVITGMGAGHVALIDEPLHLLFNRFIPLSLTTFKIVPTHVLTNATETAALLIPVTASGGQTHAPLANNRYRFDFAIDRARFRAEMPDNISNYRTAASIVTEW